MIAEVISDDRASLRSPLSSEDQSRGLFLQLGPLATSFLVKTAFIDALPVGRFKLGAEILRHPPESAREHDDQESDFGQHIR